MSRNRTTDRNLYKQWRKRGCIATIAHHRARYPSDKRRPWPLRHMSPGMGGKPGDNERWCEDPAALGMRWIGWSDELLSGRAYDHRGWYTEDDGWSGEVMRGCVWQLTGRKGASRYLAGYRHGSTNRNGRWTDAAYNSDNGATVLDVATVYIAPSGDEDSYYHSRGGDASDAIRDAAIAADGMAESNAERERDYQRAWQLARQWDEERDSLRTTRQAIADHCRLLRDARKHKSALDIAALRPGLESLCNDYDETQETMNNLESDFWYCEPESHKSITIREFAATHI